MRYASEGIMKLQNTVMQLQGEQGTLLQSCGLSQASLVKYGPQLGPYMQELVFSSQVNIDDVK